MSEEDLSTQPIEEESFPGEGRRKDEVPGNAPFESVRDKFESILEDDVGEGRFAAVVYDENGDEKERVETRRLAGPGSVEIRPFEENNQQKWSVKRKDKLPHNKQDKLGGDS